MTYPPELQEELKEFRQELTDHIHVLFRRFDMEKARCFFKGEEDKCILENTVCDPETCEDYQEDEEK
jgi:hypothetical protein